MSLRNGSPLTNCTAHGLVPVQPMCPKCLQFVFSQNKELKASLAEAPTVIEKLVAEASEKQKRIEELENSSPLHNLSRLDRERIQNFKSRYEALVEAGDNSPLQCFYDEASVILRLIDGVQVGNG